MIQAEQGKAEESLTEMQPKQEKAERWLAEIQFKWIRNSHEAFSVEQQRTGSASIFP